MTEIVTVCIGIVVALGLVIGRQRLSAWLIRLAYWLRLRRAANNAQRWLFERRAPIAGIPRFATPEDAVGYIRHRFAHRPDKSAAWLPWADWSSRPQVTQARIVELRAGGDCDDYHTWVAYCLLQMPDVEDVLLVSCWTRRRGHTVCVFRRAGALHLVDYDICRVSDIKDALELTRRRHQWTDPLFGWSFEDARTGRCVAVWPEVPS